MASAPKQIVIGRFGAPQGVRGEIRIKSYTSDPMAIAAYGPLANEAGAIYEIERARALRDDLIVAQIKGLRDRDAAARLTGQTLFAEREKLPAPDADEFYVSDLIGLRARAPTGEAIGVVVDVVNYGAGDILEIKPADSPSFMLAFTRANAPTIDFSGGEITIIRPVDAE